MSGDGGLAMMMGDLLTAIQEKIPLKIVVFNNGALGFVELEMKVEGLLNAYTDLGTPTSRASPRRSASTRGASSRPTISMLPCRIGWRSPARRFSTS